MKKEINKKCYQTPSVTAVVISQKTCILQGSGHNQGGSPKPDDPEMPSGTKEWKSNSIWD